MAQTYPNIAATDTLQNSREPLTQRDDAAASNFSGTSFPTTNLLVGMRCHRTDQNKVYALKQVSPAVWVEVEDVSGTSGKAPQATQLATSRNFSITGDVTATAVGFNGTQNVSLAAVLAASGVTAGTYTKVTVDAKGRVTVGAAITNSDLPNALNPGSILISGGNAVSLTSTGNPIQIGSASAGNMIFDVNEIQTRNNNAAAQLFLNYRGGNVTIGDGTTSVITLDGTLNSVSQMIATTAEAQAGTASNKLLTPQRGKALFDEQIDALRATASEAQAGTNSTKVMSPLRTENYVNARMAVRGDVMNAVSTSNYPIMSPALTHELIEYRKFKSSNKTITTGATITIPHGLVDTPTIIQMVLYCVTGEFGYVTGDMVFVQPNNSTSGTNRFNSVWADATNVYVTYANTSQCFCIAAKSGGNAEALTNANWRLRIHATF